MATKSNNLKFEDSREQNEKDGEKMKPIDSASGQDLRDMFAAATTWLEKSAPEIDALNVFPVPDGDKGEPVAWMEVPLADVTLPPLATCPEVRARLTPGGD